MRDSEWLRICTCGCAEADHSDGGHCNYCDDCERFELDPDETQSMMYWEGEPYQL